MPTRLITVVVYFADLSAIEHFLLFHFLFPNFTAFALFVHPSHSSFRSATSSFPLFLLFLIWSHLVSTASLKNGLTPHAVISSQLSSSHLITTSVSPSSVTLVANATDRYLNFGQPIANSLIGASVTFQHRTRCSNRRFGHRAARVRTLSSVSVAIELSRRRVSEVPQRSAMRAIECGVREVQRERSRSQSLGWCERRMARVGSIIVRRRARWTVWSMPGLHDLARRVIVVSVS